jgi:chromosome segregation ATPase
MVSTYVEEDMLSGEIDGKISAAKKLESAIAMTDRRLAARQDQLYSGEDAVYKEAMGAARRDISDASDQLDGWKAEISRLEKDCAGLRSQTDRLPAGEKEQAAGPLGELRRQLDTIRLQLTSVDSRITDLLDRVLYISERH